MSKPYIIGITGGSGSGKTSLISALANQFSEGQICIVSQDDYYRPREEQLTDQQGIKNFDLPHSIDDEAFANDLQVLLDGKTVGREEYTFNNDLATPKMKLFHPAPIIIVEGLFIFHFEAVKRLIDLKIFVHASDHLKIIRRIKRDATERNYPLDDVLYRYEHHVQPAYQRFIEPYLNEMDLIVNNNDNFNPALEVLSGFLKMKLTL